MDFYQLQENAKKLLNTGLDPVKTASKESSP